MYTIEILLGAMVGVAVSTLVAILLISAGREDCESKLPRNEKCVHAWVTPEQSAQLKGAK